MKPFDFCPACAAKLDDPTVDEGKTCPNCGRSWYRASSPTVGCVIVSDGRALITRRGKEPKKGMFDIPGGFLHAGEEVIDGLRREVDEELGVEIDVAIDDLEQIVPHTYGDEGDYVLAIGFLARLRAGDPQPNDDVAEIRWVTKDEIDNVGFAWEHDRSLVRRALEQAQEG